MRKFIVGMVAASAVTIGVSVPAFADSGCYMGCGPAPVGVVGGGPSTAPGGPSAAPGGPSSESPPAVLPAPSEAVPSSGGLPFTGEDVEQSAGIAAVLLVGGVAMVRLSRRRARATP